MNVWAHKKGFTIVEVLIVLAVTGSLSVLAFFFMNGRSQRLAFENDITDLRTKLDDVTNNVSSGYYARTNNFTCTATSGSPIISRVTSSNLGTNSDCQFLGRAVHVNTTWSNYYIHSIIGLTKVNGSGRIVSSLPETKARLLSLSQINNTGVEAAELRNLNNSKLIKTRYIKDDGSVGSDDRGFLAFISSLPSFGASGNINPGAQSVELYTVNYSINNSVINLRQSKDEVVDAFANGRVDSFIKIRTFQYCFDSLGSAQRGIVSIGQEASGTQTTQSIESGRCSAW